MTGLAASTRPTGERRRELSWGPDEETMVQSKVRVLVVDDSAVSRRLLAEALNSDPELEVVASASNGRIALDRMVQCPPDVVTLDVDMPEMNGLETLRAIKRSWPKIPVVMFSALTEQAAALTLEALAAGASAYSTKPSSPDVASTLARIREDLLPKVKALGQRLRARVAGPSVRLAGGTPGRIEAVVIGASTGGPQVLQSIFASLPADLPVPVLVVQHMPPVFTRLLAERLDGYGRLRVREAVEGAAITPGTAWLAAGDHHLVVSRRASGVFVQRTQEPPENSCRPAVDVLFRSAVEAFGAGVLGVVLTGMGKDGLRGSERIRAAGGSVLAQDEASSVVWGMPGFVAREGLADEVLTPDRITQAIVRRAALGRAEPSDAAARRAPWA